MAEQDEVLEKDLPGEEEGGDNAQDGKGRKKIMMIGAGLLVLLIVGVAAAYFTGVTGGAEESDQLAELETPSVYFDIPEMVVNLASGRERSQYLKLKIAIEAENQEIIDAMQPKMPRIQDMFQVYLREMRRSDLEGSAGVYRLKQELMRRINITIYPHKIKRVLFKEIIIQ